MPTAQVIAIQIPPEIAHYWGWFLAFGIGLLLLGVAAIVTVVFQRMRLNVQMRCAHGTREQLVRKLQQASEHCCIVLQTLRSGVPVDMTYEPQKQT